MFRDEFLELLCIFFSRKSSISFPWNLISLSPSSQRLHIVFYVKSCDFNGLIWFHWFIVINATFSNISAISWRPVLGVEEYGLPEENHRPSASNWYSVITSVCDSNASFLSWPSTSRWCNVWINLLMDACFKERLVFQKVGIVLRISPICFYMCMRHSALKSFSRIKIEN